MMKWFLVSFHNSLLQEEMTEKERQHKEIAESLEKELKSAKNQMKGERISSTISVLECLSIL